MTRHETVNPQSLGAPKGYSNGVLAAPGRLLFVAGQIGWDAHEKLVSPEFGPQFAKAMENLVEVVRAAGGEPSDVCRLTMFVVDKAEYLAALKEVGAAYRRIMGKHYPAMSLVQVADLLEPGARVEIEATAVVPLREGT